MSWKTQNARRPDLEAVEVNAPCGFIGSEIYPVEKKAEKTGTVYYQEATTPGAAQTGRSANGGAITRNYVSSANTSFSCAEKIARHSIPKDEVGNMGGIEKADGVGGKLAKLAVLGRIEADQAAMLFTGTKHKVEAGKFFASISSACKAVKRYRGQTALVCSHDVYSYILSLEEVIKRLSFTGVSIKNADAVRSIQPEVLRDMLQGIFGVDRILVGDDDYWGTIPYTGVAAVVKLPSTEEMSYKLGAELGKSFTYMLDENGLVFEIESSANDDLKINDYDGTSYVDIKELNAGAKYLLKGLTDAVFTIDGLTGSADKGNGAFTLTSGNATGNNRTYVNENGVQCTYDSTGSKWQLLDGATVIASQSAADSEPFGGSWGGGVTATEM